MAARHYIFCYGLAPGTRDILAQAGIKAIARGNPAILPDRRVSWVPIGDTWLPTIEGGAGSIVAGEMLRIEDEDWKHLKGNLGAYRLVKTHTGDGRVCWVLVLA